MIRNIHRPSITPYFPAREKATGAAVIIAPGGGHRELWISHEGYNEANGSVDQRSTGAVTGWINRFYDWLGDRGFLKK